MAVTIDVIHYKHKDKKPIKSLICQPSATAHAPIQVKRKEKNLILCVCRLIECFHLETKIIILALEFKISREF